MKFIEYLNKQHPDKNSWIYITYIDCSYYQINSLEGIKNLSNLELLNCSHNNLVYLNGIQNLSKLRKLYCFIII